MPECLRIATTADGVCVHGRCYECRADGAARYEIVIDGYGGRAVVDVAHRSHVEGLMAVAMDAFASAQRLRGDSPGSIR